jgi:4'-phosphopantetheinyl transferase EntD
MALLTALLDSDLFGAEIRDRGQPVFLPALEEALVEKAAPKRRREFALGRACARSALEKLGHGGAVIGKGANGAPLWPDGITGSITHTQNYAAALVGETRRFFGIGVDAERVGGVTRDLWPRLFDDAERDHLMSLGETDRLIIATLLFSAKEACYKAWGGRGALAFRDICVMPGNDRFTAVRAGEILQGRYAVDGDLMLTAVWF